jgi:hypothetical protein
MGARTPWLRPRSALLVVALASLATASCFGRYAFIGVGTAIDVLPDSYVTVSVGTMPYYYYGGVFYRPYRGGFVVVPAPLGAVILAPPPGHVIVLVENDPYRYYHGVFYAPRRGRFVVVRPPLGAFVRTIPRTAVSRRVRGVEYKEYAGTYFRPAIRDGRRGYQVTERPRGGRGLQPPEAG